jgi:hypothetical protein
MLRSYFTFVIHIVGQSTFLDFRSGTKTVSWRHSWLLRNIGLTDIFKNIHLFQLPPFFSTLTKMCQSERTRYLLNASKEQLLPLPIKNNSPYLLTNPTAKLCEVVWICFIVASWIGILMHCKIVLLTLVFIILLEVRWTLGHCACTRRVWPSLLLECFRSIIDNPTVIHRINYWIVEFKKTV